MPSEAFLHLGHLRLLHADLISSSVWSPNLVCFRWSRCFPGSSCTTPSRWGATTTVTTSTRESRSTSAPLRTIRGPSHITTAAACRSDLSRNQRLLKNWRSCGDVSDGRTGQEMMAWRLECVHSNARFCTFFFTASSIFYDWLCKENWQLGGLCCKEKCWISGKCAHLLSRVWFAFTVYIEQGAESRQL